MSSSRFVRLETLLLFFPELTIKPVVMTHLHSVKEHSTLVDTGFYADTTNHSHVYDMHAGV